MRVRIGTSTAVAFRKLDKKKYKEKDEWRRIEPTQKIIENWFDASNPHKVAMESPVKQQKISRPKPLPSPRSQSLVEVAPQPSPSPDVEAEEKTKGTSGSEQLGSYKELQFELEGFEDEVADNLPPIARSFVVGQ